MNKTEADIDIFNSRFDVTRKWVRLGDPIKKVRQVLRLQQLNAIDSKWSHRVLGHHGEIFGELRLFGDWYGISFTSSPEKVGSDLKSFSGEERPDIPIWCISNTLTKLDDMR